MSHSAAGVFRRVNDAVYWTGAVIACVALVHVTGPHVSAELVPLPE